MKSIFVVISVLFGSAYCRSIPAVDVPIPKQLDSLDVESLNGNPVTIVRKARQFGNIFKIFSLEIVRKWSCFRLLQQLRLQPL